MLRTRDDLYSSADYQPITDEHFIRRACNPVEEVQEDDEQYFDDWKDLQSLFH